MERLLGALLFCSLAAHAAPDVRHWTTTNGARVYFVQAEELPMVDVRIVFDAGSARDGATAGLAALTNAVLGEGAGGLSANRISERFEAVGAEFDTEALRDMAWVSLRSITDPSHLEPALATLALVLEKPDFPDAAFERQRKRMLVALAQEEQLPDKVAEKAFYKSVYGEHPYAGYPGGSLATLNGLRRADSRSFFAKYYTAGNAVVAIIGDLSEVQAKALAERIVGKLPAGKRARPLPQVMPLQDPIELTMVHPSTQTHILLGQPGMTRGDPDYYPLYVGNHALGGSGLVSRLSEEVREKRGLSYSVFSYFLPMRAKGPFMAGLQTKNEQAEAALQVLKNTIREYVDEGPTGGQLEASIQNITGGFPLRIDSNAKIVEYLAMIGFYDLPVDYLNTFVDKVSKMTQEKVREALKRRLSPQTMATIMVGGQATDVSEAR